MGGPHRAGRGRLDRGQDPVRGVSFSVDDANLSSSIHSGCVGLLASVLLLGGCAGSPATPEPPPPGAIAPGTALGSASVSGRVVLVGEPPKPQKLSMSDAGCHAGAAGEAMTETVVANPDGTLRNVIVRVRSGLGDRVFAPPEAAVMDQIGCVYKPHVSAIMANQLVTFVNSDATVHNVHAIGTANRGFNFGMPTKGQRVSRFFAKPEIVKVRCDVHPWMLSYIGVFENPYHVVTADGGSFLLSALPAGTYEIEAWHESFGALSQSIALGEGEAGQLEFRFGG